MTTIICLLRLDKQATVDDYMMKKSHKTVVKPIGLDSKISILQFINVGIAVGLGIRNVILFVQLHVPTIVHH